MHIGNIRLPNVFEKGPVTVKMPIYFFVPGGNHEWWASAGINRPASPIIAKK